MTLKCICIRNPLSFNFSPKYLSINGSLIFTTPILLTLSSNAALFVINWLITSYSCPTVTGYYKSVSTILISPPNLKVVAAVNSVIVAAFSGILFNFLYLIL